MYTYKASVALSFLAAPKPGTLTNLICGHPPATAV